MQNQYQLATNYPNSKSMARLTRSSRKSGAQVAFLSLFVLAVLNIANPWEAEFVTMLLASGVFIIGILPLIFWFRNEESGGLPVFQAYMVFCAITLGVAGFFSQDSTLTTRQPVGVDEWNQALLTVLISLLCTWGTYRSVVTTQKLKRSLLVPVELTPKAAKPFFVLALFLLISGYFIRSVIPSVLAQILQSILLFLNAALLVLVVKFDLGKQYKRLVLFVVTPTIALVLSSFDNAAIAGFFMSLLPVALILLSRNRKIPWLLVILLGVLFLTLQPIKGEYRARTWGSVNTASAEGFLAFGLSRSMERFEVGMSLKDWFSDGFRRLNHIHVTAAVIADTPERVPFQKGATYRKIFFKIIPRAIWPDKPKENIGNSWAHLYGYLYRTDNVTSFNLPVITEMYMNFGLLGVVALSAILGLVFGWLYNRFWYPGASILSTAAGVVIGLPLMVPESNLSLILGQSIISIVSIFFTLLAFKVVMPEMFVSR